MTNEPSVVGRIGHSPDFQSTSGFPANSHFVSHSELYTCGRCGGSYERRIGGSNVRCAVMHSQDDCCHYGEHQVTAGHKVIPKGLFSSTADQAEGLSVTKRQLEGWFQDIDDILLLLESGQIRETEQAIVDLEAVQNRIHDVIRSANAPVRSDRTAG